MKITPRAMTGGDALRLLVPLSLAAGIVHAALVGEHMSEYTLYGYGFVAMAAFQIFWGVAAFRGASRGLVALGLAGNLAFLATWGLSRVAGLPFGPHLWEREAISLVDPFAVVPEAAFVAIAAVALRHGRRNVRGAGDQSVFGGATYTPQEVHSAGGPRSS